jgi:hypothetical protein
MRQVAGNTFNIEFDTFALGDDFVDIGRVCAIREDIVVAANENEMAVESIEERDISAPALIESIADDVECVLGGDYGVDIGEDVGVKVLAAGERPSEQAFLAGVSEMPVGGEEVLGHLHKIAPTTAVDFSLLEIHCFVDGMPQ